MSSRNTWAYNPTGGARPSLERGVHIKRLTAELVQTAHSHLSARSDSKRNSASRLSESRKSRKSAHYARKWHTAERHISIKRDEQEEERLESDLKEAISVVERRGKYLDELSSQQDDRAESEADDIDGEEMGESLRKARAEAVGGHFIPRDALDRLLTEGNIKRELRRKLGGLQDQDLGEIVHKICGQPGPANAAGPQEASSSNYRRIFGILTMMDRSEDILQFIAANISDEQLPVSETKLREAHLDAAPTQQILERQWEVLAPVFSAPEGSSKVPFFDLQQKDVLPWTRLESGESAGGYAKVTKVTIHPSHHLNRASDGKKKTDLFALKKLNRDNREDWAHEVNALQKIASSKQDHLISLLATFKQGQEYNLVFEWADGGDIRDFWKKNQPPEFDRDFLDWIAQQFLGLTQAVKAIHKVSREDADPSYGRHGDIKPENILLFMDKDKPKNRGTLKIADLGLTRFKSAQSEKYVQLGATPTYRAPEYDLDDALTSQKYDIWSLGCLYLEFITWALTGSPGQNDSFTAARTMEGPQNTTDDSYFFVFQDEKGTKTAQIKPSVKNWIGRLRENPRASSFMHSMLDIIENNMLVVDPSKRIDAGGTEAAIQQAIESAREEASNSETLPGIDSESLSGIGREPLPASLGSQARSRDVSTPRETVPIDMTDLRVEQLGPITELDKLRLFIERCYGGEIRWFPLPEPDRRLATSKARLVWDYYGQDISIHLNEKQSQRYKHLLRTAVANSILPTANPTSSVTPISYPIKANRWQTFLRNIPSFFESSQKQKPVPQSGTATANQTQGAASTPWKEFYFCLDKQWTSYKETIMHTVPAIETLSSDQDLFLHLRNETRRTQGAWIYRWISPKTCTRVQLSRFAFLFNNNDAVHAFDAIAVGKPHDICKGYDYSPLPNLAPEDHMRLMAEAIFQGIQRPELGLRGRAVLEGIPKLQSPPGLDKKQFNVGWGFYATQGLSMMTALAWIAVIIVLGLVFVPVWLTKINPTDLQNAFVPVTVLASFIAIVLGLVAIFRNF